MRLLFLLSIFIIINTSVVAAQNHNYRAIEGQQLTEKTAEIEKYLNSLKTFQANFEQGVGGMQPSSGMFYFKRPGRFLWQYQTPDPIKLVSSGGLIYFYDETSKQVNQIPREGIADFLTRPEIKLNNDNFVVEELAHIGGLLHLRIRLKDSEVGDIGSTLSLTFLENPIQLRQITTTNQFDQPVEVLLYNIRENKPLNNKVFAFIPPQYQER